MVLSGMREEPTQIAGCLRSMLKRSSASPTEPATIMRRFKAVLAFLGLHLCTTSLGVASIWLYLHGEPESLLAPLGAGIVVAVWTLPLMVFVAYFIGADVLIHLRRIVRSH